MDRYQVRVFVFKMALIATFCGNMATTAGEHLSLHLKDNPFKVLQAIRSYPENYQQLINAFYPVNRAKPSSVIIAYFINYTESDQLPGECSLGTFPWKTRPSINQSYQYTKWYVWTTAPIYSIAGKMTLEQFGEYLPTESYYFTFNRTIPLLVEMQIACIKLPSKKLEYYALPHEAGWKHYDVLGDVTSQVSHYHNGQ